MKSHMLYAPVLLLSLSMACGKADHDKSARDVAVENIQAAQQLADAGAADVITRPVSGPLTEEAQPALTPSANPLADEVTPTPGVGPVVTPPAPPAPGPAAPAPVGNSPLPSPAPTNQPAPAPAPAPNGPVTTPVTEEATAAVPTLSSGVPAIDETCKKSYLAIEAKQKQDEPAFQALKLSSAAHKVCYDAVVSTTGKLFSDMDTLGLPILHTANGQRVILGAKNWPTFAGRLDALQTVLGTSDFLANDQQNFVYADANERLEYIQLSIAEIKAKDPATLSDFDKDNLTILMSSLPVQVKLIETIVKRVQTLGQIPQLSILGFQMAQLAQMLALPPTPPPVQPAPAQPTSPATGTGSPETPNTNTPNTPQPVTPLPEPLPEPTPLPDPTPAPLPAPTP